MNGQRNRQFEGQSGAPQSRGNQGIRCFRCQRIGHIARDCYARIPRDGERSREYRQRKRENERVNVVEEGAGQVVAKQARWSDDSENELLESINAVLGESNASIEAIRLKEERGCEVKAIMSEEINLDLKKSARGNGKR